jgi:hypothetical protein
MHDTLAIVGTEWDNNMHSSSQEITKLDGEGSGKHMTVLSSVSSCLLSHLRQVT